MADREVKRFVDDYGIVHRIPVEEPAPPAADDLVTWLRAQIDADEAKAVAAKRAANREGQLPGGDWVAAGGLVGGPPDDPRHELGWPLWDCEGSDTLCMNPDTAEHVANFDPDRALREVEAKRQIIEMHAAAVAFASRPDSPASGAALALGDVVRALALLYSDRPGYREEWRP